MALLGNSDNQIGILIRSDADTKAIDNASKSVANLEKSAGGGSKAAALLGTAGKAAAVGIAAASAASAALGVSAIKSAGSYEQSRIAFETMLGSADKARGLMTDIAEFAKTTPFELPEVVSGTKQLLAFGFAQKDLLPTMKKLGDLASGLGVPVGQLTNVFGQVKVAGRLMGQDLLQFTNAGVPMIEALATTMKKPQSEIKKLVEQGKIGFPEVEKALNSLTGEGSKFGGMMAKQSKSFNGIVSNIKDGFGQILRSAVGITAAGDIIEGGLFDRIKNAAETVLPYVAKLAEKVGPFMGSLMSDMGSLVKQVIELGKQIATYLGPKFEALFNTIRDDLLPVLADLWKNYLEPLVPVIGTVLVGALGLALDAINFLIAGFTKLVDWIKNNQAIFIGLATTFGILAGAMAFNNVFNALTVGFNTLKLVTIPSVMTSVGALQAAIATPVVMGAIGIGLAIAALAQVKSAWNELRAIRDEIARTENKLSDARQDYGLSLKARFERGEITAAERARLWKESAPPGYSSGGFTGRGDATDVAGVVHKGEYVIPKSGVDQSSGLPKASGVINNRTVSIQNLMIGTPDAAREFFRQLDSDLSLTGFGLTPRMGA